MATQHQTPPNPGYRSHQWGSVGAGHQHPAAAATATYYQRYTATQQPSAHAATQSQVVSNAQQVQQQQAQSPAAQHPNSYTPNSTTSSSYNNSNSVGISEESHVQSVKLSFSYPKLIFFYRCNLFPASFFDIFKVSLVSVVTTITIYLYTKDARIILTFNNSYNIKRSR